MTSTINPTDNDERLKKRLIIKSRNGCAIISVYNPDMTAKKRRTSRRTRILEQMIIDAGFEYKSVTTDFSPWNKKTEFIVFEKIDDGFNDPGIMLAPFVEECKASNRFQCFTIHHDIEQFLRDKTFEHPLLKKDKEAYKARREIYLEDLFEPPAVIGNWDIKHALSETSAVYQNSSYLCIIEQLPDGTWKRVYGTCRPVGATLKKEIVATREEAFSNLKLKFEKPRTLP